jgi:hypothetical protein
MIFTSTGTGVIYLNLDFSSAPAFITAAGSLGSTYELLPFSYTIQANADSNIAFSVQSGSLPANSSLQSNGVLSGNGPAVENSTLYSIVVLAEDQENQTATRSFNFTILPDLITWYNPSGNVSYVFPTNFPMSQTQGNVTLNAQAISNQPITYTANTLPTGITLNGNLISGTPTVQGNVFSLLSATSAVTNKTANVLVTFKIRNTFDVNNYQPYFANCIALEKFDAAGQFISPDGTNLYVTDTLNDRLIQYTMQANTLSTATVSATLAITANGLAASNPQSVIFKDDGTKMFVAADPNTPWINEYVLSQPWNINSAVFVSNLNASPFSAISIDSIAFANSGQRLYTMYSSGVREWTLGTPWQINTAVITSRSTSLPVGTYGFVVTNDGTTLWNANSSTIQKRSLTVPFQINASTVLQSASTLPATTPFINSSINSIRYMQISSDGRRIYYIADPLVNPIVFTTELTVPNDLTSMQYNELSGFYGYTATGLRIKDDGLKLWAVDGLNLNNLSEYTLSRAFDVGSANIVSNLAITLTSSTGLAFKDDGTRLFVSNATRINEYTLSTPWQTNNAVLAGNLTVTTITNDLAFSSNGDRMFLINSSSDNILEYHLTTPWQVNTAAQRGTYSIVAYETAGSSLFFNSFGNVVFFTGTGSDSIHQLNLSTPWQINTASYIGNVSLAFYETAPVGMCLNSTGTNLYFSGSTYDLIYQWKLG